MWLYCCPSSCSTGNEASSTNSFKANLTAEFNLNIESEVSYQIKSLTDSCLALDNFSITSFSYTKSNFKNDNSNIIFDTPFKNPPTNTISNSITTQANKIFENFTNEIISSSIVDIIKSYLSTSSFTYCGKN